VSAGDVRPGHLSGIEYLLKVIGGELPLPPMCETVPMRFTHAGDGLVNMTAIAEPRHGNALGGIHGGFAATVIDTATGCAVLTKMVRDDTYTTINLELKMVRPVPLDETLYVEGRLVNMSRRLAIAEAELRNGEGKLLAQGSAACMVFRGPGAP
jgi:uncharacterized protein (TIGR00369 family)